MALFQSDKKSEAKAKSASEWHAGEDLAPYFKEVWSLLNHDPSLNMLTYADTNLTRTDLPTLSLTQKRFVRLLHEFEDFDPGKPAISGLAQGHKSLLNDPSFSEPSILTNGGTNPERIIWDEDLVVFDKLQKEYLQWQCDIQTHPDYMYPVAQYALNNFAKLSNNSQYLTEQSLKQAIGQAKTDAEKTMLNEIFHNFQKVEDAYNDEGGLFHRHDKNGISRNDLMAYPEKVWIDKRHPSSQYIEDMHLIEDFREAAKQEEKDEHPEFARPKE